MLTCIPSLMCVRPVAFTTLSACPIVLQLTASRTRIAGESSWQCQPRQSIICQPRVAVNMRTHPLSATGNSVGKLQSNVPLITSHIAQYSLLAAHLQDPAAVGCADGRRANSFIFAFLDGLSTDQASTNNLHLMSQIGHHARDHEFFAEMLSHSDMLFMFFLHKVDDQPPDPLPPHSFTYDLSFPFVTPGG
jgi:hypothetical protein